MAAGARNSRSLDLYRPFACAGRRPGVGGAPFLSEIAVSVLSYFSRLRTENDCTNLVAASGAATLAGYITITAYEWFLPQYRFPWIINLVLAVSQLSRYEWPT